jgi:hypothetical protein
MYAHGNSGGVVVAVTVAVLMLIVASYIGRLILCRILLTDIPRLLFLVLL